MPISPLALVLPLSTTFLLGPSPALLLGPAPPPGPDDQAADQLGNTEVPELSDRLDQALTPVRGGLTADEVAGKALAASTTVVVKDADIDAAAAKVDQTIVQFLPNVQLLAQYTRISYANVSFGSGALVGALNAGGLQVGACPMGGGNNCVVDSKGVPVGATPFKINQVLDNYLLQASLSVPLSDYVFRMVKGLAAAKNSKDAAELAKQAEARKVATDARIAYYNWLRAVAQVAVTEEARATAEARLQDARVGFEVGTIAKVDVLRLEAQVANAEKAVITARSFEEVSRRNLSVIMDEPVHAYQVGEDVMGPVFESGDWPELARLVDEAEANRLELKSMHKNRQAVQNGIKTEFAGYFPRIDGFGSAVYSNPNSRYYPPRKQWHYNWSVGVSLTWTINSTIAAKPRIRQLKAQKRSLDAQTESLRRGIEMEVTNAYVARKNALAGIAIAEKAMVASDAAYDATTAQFKAGTATATDLIQAQGERVSAQLQTVNARIDLRVAEAQLRYASGRAEPAGKHAIGT